MASRINKRFALTLSAIGLSCAVVLGGVGYLFYRIDETRHIKAGDRLMAEGHYERAMREYGRGLGKKMENLEYLAKYRNALTSLKPVAAEQAKEWYVKLLGTYQHEVTYRPDNADAHLTLIRQLYDRARLMRAPARWAEVGAAADAMQVAIPEDDPQAAEAKLYLGLATLRQSPVPTEQEINDAEQYLRDYVAARPDSDAGWTGLISTMLAVGQQFAIERNPRRAQEKFDEADRLLAAAREQVTDGPEFSRLRAFRLAQLEAQDGQVNETEELSQAVNKMVQLVAASGDPILLVETSRLLRQLDRTDGIQRGIDLLKEFLAGEPDQHFQRFVVAELMYLNGDLDEAYEAATTVVDAEPVPVSLLSMFHPYLRRQAGSLIVDIDYARWEQADEAEKDQQLHRVADAITRLAEQVGDQDLSVYYQRAQGKIAMARRDYSTAASRFERVIELGGDDAEILWFASRALEQIGEYGAALSRLDQFLAIQPRNPAVLGERARMLFNLGRLEEATEAIEACLRLSPDLEAALDLQQRIAQAGEVDDENTQDPVAVAVKEVVELLKKDEYDAARTLVTPLLEADSENAGLMALLAEVEMRAGDVDRAKGHIDAALMIQPNNATLKRMQIVLETDDPIERIHRYTQQRYPDETEQTIAALVQMRRQAHLFESRARRLADQGDTNGADEAQVEAERTHVAADELRDKAERLAAEDPILLEHLFTEELMTQNWTAAQAIAERARAVNADQVNGLVFRGRIELGQGQFTDAIRTLGEAVQRKSYSSLAWRLLGKAYEGAGNIAEAQRAYENAFDRNPRDRYAVIWYIGLLTRTGENVVALRVLRDSKRLVENDPELREAWLRLEGTAGDLLLALNERRDSYDADPSNRANAVQLAALLGNQMPDRETITGDDGEVEYDEQRWRQLSPESRQQLIDEQRDSWILESAQILDQLEQGGANIDIAVLRASLLRSRGQIDEGEQTLVRFIFSHDESERTVDMYLRLAQYLSGVRRFDKAKYTLIEGRDWQSDENREADRALANLHYAFGRFEEAIELYTDPQALGGRLAPAETLRLVECYVGAKQLDQAQSVLDEVIATDGRGYFMLMLQASIDRGIGDQLFESGDFDEAALRVADERASLAAAQQVAPTNPVPHIQRAKSYLKEFQRTQRGDLLDEATHFLSLADEVRAGLEQTSLTRVDVLVAQQDLRGARGELRRLLDRRPDSVNGRRRLVDLFVADGLFDQAIGELDAALARNATLPQWHETKGNVLTMRGDMEGARQAYLKAYELSPVKPLLVKLIETAVRSPQPNMPQVVATLEADPATVEGVPRLRELYAIALLGTGRKDDAMTQMKMAYEDYQLAFAQHQPVNPAALAEWFATLVGLYGGNLSNAEIFMRGVAGDRLGYPELHQLALAGSRAPGGLARAIELQEQALAKAPSAHASVRGALLFHLAMFHLTAGNDLEAVTTFEEVLSLLPDNVQALNNAAYLYAQKLGEPEKALPLIERANELSPGQSYILDTLGWVHYLLGNYGDAETYIRDADEIRKTAENQWHYAAVLHATGRSERALRYLDQAMILSPDSATKAEIDRLLADIQDEN